MTIRTFVAKICIHEAHTRQLAGFVFKRVYWWLLELAEVAGCGEWFKSSAALLTLRSGQIKNLLFLRIIELMAEHGEANTARWLEFAAPNELPPEELFGSISPAMKELVDKHCYLRDYHPRNSAQAEAGSFELPYRRRPDCCVRACDVLLLTELGFQIREIGDVLRVPKSTVDRAMGRCDGILLDAKPPQDAVCSQRKTVGN